MVIEVVNDLVQSTRTIVLSLINLILTVWIYIIHVFWVELDGISNVTILVHVLVIRSFYLIYFYQQNQEASEVQTLENSISYSAIIKL